MNVPIDPPLSIEDDTFPADTAELAGPRRNRVQPHRSTQTANLLQAQSQAMQMAQIGGLFGQPKTEIELEPQPGTFLARYDFFFNPQTGRQELRPTSDPVVVKKSINGNIVLLVKRILDLNGQLQQTVIEIMHEPLRKLLVEIHRNVEATQLTTNTPTIDPKLLFNSRIQLRERLAAEAGKETPDEDLIKGIDTALLYLQEDWGETETDFDTLLAQGEITYDLLWALFPPNTYVRAYHTGTEQELVLYSRSMAYQVTPMGSFAVLKCDLVNNDGKAFGLAVDSRTINQFAGTRRLTDLPIVPLELYAEKDRLRELAIRRGKQFANIDRYFCECSGPAVVEGGFMIKAPVKVQTTDRIMVDPAAYRLFRPQSTINRHVDRKLDPKDMTDEQNLITTPILLGFCFGTKAWGGYALDRIKEITWAEESFQKLVLGEKQKRLIRSLVRQHSTKITIFDDIIAGKGQGLVGLLSGNPGCGKTLTAEAVAEVTHRPLYIVSAGELGTEPKHLDAKLSELFELAQLWDAVLLLDEADVFLQARNTLDVSRNALVSIFLRQVEYYRGILIFTTNLIAEIDRAFESRIHFCVRYPDLDFESRKAVWKTFFGRALTSEHDVSEEELDRLAKHHLNGRQIKNAVSTAQSIALEQNSRLLAEHVDTVLEVMSDWHPTQPSEVA